MTGSVSKTRPSCRQASTRERFTAGRVRKFMCAPAERSRRCFITRICGEQRFLGSISGGFGERPHSGGTGPPGYRTLIKPAAGYDKKTQANDIRAVVSGLGHDRSPWLPTTSESWLPTPMRQCIQTRSNGWSCWILQFRELSLERNPP
jgi:hypothetical protein